MKSGGILAAAVCFWCGVCSVSGGTWQFDRNESWYADRGVDLRMEPAGLVVRIREKPDWNKPPFTFNLREKRSLKHLGSPDRVEFEVELQDGGGTTVGLYLKDAAGEFFAYPQRPLKRGLNRVGWNVRQEAIGHWGKGGNGKIDFPVRLEAVILHQYPAQKSSTLRFRNPDAEAVPGVDSVFRELKRFDDSAKWQGARKLVYARKADGLLVKSSELPSEEKKCIIERMQEVSFPLQNIGSPFAIELDVELLSGSGVNLALELTDAAGETFALRQKAVPAGRSRLVWNLSADISGSWGKNKNGKIDMPIMLNSITYFQYPAKEAGEVLFHSLGKWEEMRDIDSIDFVYETGSPLPVLKVGEERKFGMKLTNGFPAENDFSVRILLRNYRGRQLRYERDFKLLPGASVFWPLAWSAENDRGVWRATIELTSRDGLRSRRDGRTSFVYMEPAGPNNVDNPEFILGYNLRQQRWSWNDQKIEAAAAALSGAKLLRTGYTWEGIERTEGTFDFIDSDRLLELNHSLGMEHMFLIGYTPYFAARPETRNTGDWNDWNKSVPDDRKLEIFCQKLAEHYRGKIRFYEFWNEPDLEFWRGSLEEYLDRLQTVYRTIKKTDPEAFVISGGIASDLPRSKAGFHKGLVAKGQEYFDFHGYHQHGDFATYERILAGPVAEYRKQLRSRKPLFFTETGFYISNGNYMQQAINVVKKIVHARVLGARGYIWFDLRDDGFLPGYCEHNYGLLTHDWFPKEGYAAYNTVNLQLARARRGGTLLKNDRTTAHWFRDGGDQVVVIWKTNVKGVEEPLTIRTDAAAARWIDIMGNPMPVEVIAGRVTLPVPEFPGYLRLVGTRTAPLLGESIVRASADGMAAVPGQAAEVRFSVRNPQNKEMPFAWRWQLPEDVRAVPAEGERKLAAGESVDFSAMVTIPEHVAGNALRIALNYTLGNEKGRLIFPINVATRIAKGEYSRQPQFQLRDREHMVSQMEHNPYTSHRIWSGPEDQSADIFLAAGDGLLKVRVCVTDDVHVKSKNAENCFMEDGLQLALAIPGQPGHWEFGFAELEDGAPGTHIWIRPDGFSSPDLRLAVSHPAKNRTVYEIGIPMAAIGLTQKQLKAGIQFNLLINENDGEGRDGWLQIAPGIGEAKVPEKYPFILF